MKLLDNLISGSILIITFYIIFFIGKIINDWLHREYNTNYELFERDNAALAVAIVGYYFGLVLTIGGILIGPSVSILDDILDVVIYGILGIILLNISWYISYKLILYKFNVTDELIRDQNIGTGAVIAGVNIASGFIIYGSIQGEGGHIGTVIAFWAIGQIFLVLAGFIYSKIVRYDIHAEIEKDNIAAGVSFAGALIGIGIIIGLSGESHFESWEKNLSAYLIYATLGLILLPIIRFVTDLVLIPNVTLEEEIAKHEKPNIGAAYIEAFSYIAGAFIIYWCI
ncbi:MAG: DUF350 domain-containing protein [Desulfobacterales bacterium]|nr:DUF350 domain-containing protein [Desulfobacterales bacterium]MBF0398058.1 DUF350 domain-containing protein [Desulfobacterales bacterium]